MPLIQWIMQNLNVKKEVGVGVVVGGEAEKRILYQTLASGGVKIGGDAIDKILSIRFGVVAGGQALIQKISSIFSSGGVEVGGDSKSQKTRSFKFVVNHLPGDLVYDSCNGAGLVIGIKLSSYAESEYIVDKSSVRIIIPESLLSYTPSRLDPFFIEGKIEESKDLIQNPFGYPINNGLFTDEYNNFKNDFCEDEISNQILKLEKIDCILPYQEGIKVFDESISSNVLDACELQDRYNRIKNIDFKFSNFYGTKYISDFSIQKKSICGIEENVQYIKKSIDNPSNFIVFPGQTFLQYNSNDEKICFNEIESKSKIISDSSFNAPVYKNKKKSIESK